MIPIQDTVIFEPQELTSILKTSGQTNLGTVAAVGKGGYDYQGVRIPMEVKEGDTILFPPPAVSVMKLRDKDIHFIKERDIIAIL